MFPQNTLSQLNMKELRRKISYLGGVVLLFWVTMLAVIPGQAHAYNQVSSRSIKMSSTAVSATNVAYQVNFTTVTNNQTIGSVVVEFCSNSPILGDTCSNPAGFLNTNFSTLTLNSVTGNITGLTIDKTDSTSNRLVLTRTAGAVANGPVSFTLGDGSTNGLTNPSTNATFYARIMTFTNTTGSAGGNENTNSTDAGGIAISTANQLNVTAKVQESLLFCVYTGATCSAGGTAVTLGDQNGVLASTTTTYTANANFDVASNAVHGVSVHMQGTTLKSGSFTIAPAGATCLTDPTSSSTEMFGLRMLTLGTGTSATAPYNCTTGSHAFDSSTTSGIPSLFGEEIASTSGPTDVSSSTIELAAKSANTTSAGIYTTTLTLIATATY